MCSHSYFKISHTQHGFSCVWQWNIVIISLSHFLCYNSFQSMYIFIQFSEYQQNIQNLNIVLNMLTCPIPKATPWQPHPSPLKQSSQFSKIEYLIQYSENWTKYALIENCYNIRSVIKILSQYSTAENS